MTETVTLAGDASEPERDRPAGAVGRRALRELGARRGRRSSRRRPPSRRPGRSRSRPCRCCWAGIAAIGESTFVILLGSTPPTTPAASFVFVTAPLAIFDVVTALLLSCTEPTEAVPDHLSCPARAAQRHEQRDARNDVRRRQQSAARVMLPPSLVVAYRIVGDRHPSRLNASRGCRQKVGRIAGAVTVATIGRWSSAASRTSRRTSSS